MVTNQYYVGNIEPFQNSLLPLELIAQTPICQISAMNHKIHIISRIDCINGIVQLIVPALRIAQDSKSNLITIGTLLLNSRQHAMVNSALLIHTGIVSMILCLTGEAKKDYCTYNKLSFHPLIITGAKIDRKGDVGKAI